jgi:uncharacterized membrane protein
MKRLPKGAYLEGPGFGCLAILVVVLFAMTAIGYVVEDLAHTPGGRVTIAASFFIAVIAFIGALILTPCRREYR